MSHTELASFIRLLPVNQLHGGNQQMDVFFIYAFVLEENNKVGSNLPPRLSKTWYKYSTSVRHACSWYERRAVRVGSIYKKHLNQELRSQLQGIEKLSPRKRDSEELVLAKLLYKLYSSLFNYHHTNMVLSKLSRESISSFFPRQFLREIMLIFLVIHYIQFETAVFY